MRTFTSFRQLQVVLSSHSTNIFWLSGSWLSVEALLTNQSVIALLKITAVYWSYSSTIQAFKMSPICLEVMV